MEIVQKRSKWSRKKTPTVYRGFCRAKREIEIVESVNGLYNQYLAIRKVEGVSVNPISVIGESTPEKMNKVEVCSRCVVPFHRKCDLSTITMENLDPQTIKQS